jgi:pimeloyl-ACP methyl ester carboxylesterase
LIAADIMLRLFTPEFFEQRPEDLHGIEHMLQTADPQPVDAFLAQLAVLAEHDAVDRLPHLDVPTLVLAGQRDAPTHCAASGNHSCCAIGDPAERARAWPKTPGSSTTS